MTLYLMTLKAEIMNLFLLMDFEYQNKDILTNNSELVSHNYDIVS